VHRLDKETSGLMIVAKHNSAHYLMSKQFQDREIKKEYWALIYGHLKKKKGLIENKIGRSLQNRKKISSRSPRGKWAKTEYEVLKEYACGLSEVLIHPLTGRTHQIRVHFSEMGYPLVGDKLYGGSSHRTKSLNPLLQKKIQELNRHCLHALKISFGHPLTGKKMSFNSELSEELKALLLCLE